MVLGGASALDGLGAARFGSVELLGTAFFGTRGRHDSVCREDGRFTRNTWWPLTRVATLPGRGFRDMATSEVGRRGAQVDP